LVAENEKNIVVKVETWLRVGKRKSFPERSTFDSVINWLLDEQEKREEAMELVK